MGDKEFQTLVKKVVCEYANAHLDVSDVIQISEDDVVHRVAGQSPAKQQGACEHDAQRRYVL